MVHQRSKNSLMKFRQASVQWVASANAYLLNLGVTESDDDESATRTRLFNGFCWLSAVVSFGLGAAFTFNGQWQITAAYWSYSAVGVLCLLLMNKSYFDVARILSFGAALGLVVALAFAGGHVSQTYVFLPCILTAIFMTTKMSAPWLWALGLATVIFTTDHAQYVYGVYGGTIVTLALMTWIRHELVKIQGHLKEERIRLQNAILEKNEKVHELSVMTEQLAIEAMKDETKADEMSELVRILSHDLQNQLTVVKLSLELAATTIKNGGDAMPFLERIEKASDEQVKIIHHIRKMRSIAEGKEHLSLAPVSLSTTFEQAEQTFQNILEKKKIRLVKDLNVDFARVIADESSFQHQVFNNLISNAIKFSFENSEIHVSVYHDHSVEGEFVIVTVSDKGVGMDEKRVAEIFRPNHSTSTKGTSGEIGTGFGMPLVKSYIERFGGSIGIKSVPKSENASNHGTKVILRLKSAKALQHAA
jgi:signal transduction histidine kinase